jgi:hypothetical protein
MALFRDLIARDEGAERRFRKAGNGMTLGVQYLDGKPFIWVYEDGQASRILSRKEMQALLVDVDNDWQISNQ